MTPEAKQDLSQWLLEALRALGGAGSILEICHRVWENHEADLRSRGPLFYTWQYDIRWVATDLRHQGLLRAASASRRGIWEVVE